MNGTLAVIARELQEWKRVFAAALASGLLVYLAPLLPGARNYSALETMNTGAAMIAVAFGFGVALIAGAAFIGRDLSERRLSFYFFKPLATGSIWSGKLIAAILLALLSTIFVLIPVTLAGGGLLTLGDDATRKVVALLAGGIVAIVVLANSFTLSFRARSPWVLMDLAAPMAITGLLALAAAPLARNLAFGLITSLGVIFLTVFFAGLLIASYRGLSRGRTELREVHRVHALTLWPICAVAALGLAGFSVWVRSATPNDLRETFVEEASPTGPWIAITGFSPARADYHPAFLFNVEQNRSVRLGQSWVRGTLRFSHEGKVAVWLEPVGYNPAEARLMVATLGDGTETRETKIFATPQVSDLAISPDGSRVALLSGRMLTVFDLRDERALGSVQLPLTSHRSMKPRIRFASPQVVRIFLRSGDRELVIFEFATDRRLLERTGSITTEQDMIFAATGSEPVLVRQKDPGRESMHDPRTGELLYKLPVPGGGMRAVLSDGRLAILRVAQGRASVQVFSTSGQAGAPIDLGAANNVRLGSEIDPGKLLVSISSADVNQPEDFHRNNQLLQVDVDAGEIRKLADNLVPLRYLWWGEGLPTPGSIGTRIFQSEDQGLVFFDPKTGRRTAIAGRNAS